MKYNKMWLGTELYSGSYGIKYKQYDIDNIISMSEEIGINKIDTAECYGTEELIGLAIKNKRNRFTLATKFGHSIINGGKNNSFDKRSVEKQLNNSLFSLNTDYIDIYYFHSGDNSDFQNDELWSFLQKKKRDGVIRELGLSIQHSLVVNKDYSQLELLKDYKISIVQTVLNLFSKQSLEYVVPFCKKNKLQILGRMPLAKGLLSGNYSKGHIFKNDDQRSKSIEFNNNILVNDSYSVKESLEWVSSKVDGVVIGSKNKKQLLENFSIINKS